MLRKTFVSLFALLATCLSLSGCALYDVKKYSDNTKDPGGIPFYTVTVGCKREVSQVIPYFNLTLSRKEGDKSIPAGLTTACFLGSQITELQKKIAAANNEDAILDAWSKVPSCDPRGETAFANAPKLSDVVSPYKYVDYGTTYTLNVKRPVNGSVSATTKLASDGTLTEGTAQADEEIVSSLLNAAASVFAPGAAPAAAAAPPLTTPAPVSIESKALPAAPTINYELKIEPKFARLTKTYRDEGQHGSCASDTALTSATPPGHADFVISDVDSDAKKPADNAIKVNGTIELPKAKDAAKSPAK